MHITRVKIQNFRTLRSTQLALNDTMNIIVGDNEIGKSTLLEAINLCLTGHISGRSILFDLHPFLFNNSETTDYVQRLRRGEHPAPPCFQIELFFNDDAELAALKGTNNSDREDVPGLLLKAELNEAFNDEYASYISDPSRINTVPVEFYKVVWRTFAGKDLSPRTRPLKTALIDNADQRNSGGPQRYLLDAMADYLSSTERVQLAISYRHMKETFQADASVAEINRRLETTRGEISEKQLSVSLDTTAKGSWESGVVANLDGIPFGLVGRGEQSSVRIQLAMADAADVEIFLIEEPECHLSHTRLNSLITKIQTKAGQRQTFVTTHSSFVLNKLDVGQVILFNGTSGLNLNDLSDETRDYFKKLPGHDTLRLILAQKVILVEGPSDELILQKAIVQRYGVPHQSLGVDIISVKSLAFKRFLEISSKLEISTLVVTDNDGNVASLLSKYEDYLGSANIQICFDNDEAFPSLEDQILRANGLVRLNTILDTEFDDGDETVEYMKKNKTETALTIFNSAHEFVVPNYIENAIRELDR